MIRIFFSLIILMVALAAEAKTVTTLGQYRLYNQLHVKRVGLLGENIFLENRQAFAHVNFSLVREFLAQHDYAKINDLEIQAKLFSIYGVEIDTPELQARREATVVLLNEEDKQYSYAFFVARNLVNDDGSLKPAAQQLLRIELIADYVDRFKNPLAREEFARKMLAASRHPDLTDNERWMALEAEAKYFDVVYGYLFSQYDGCDGILGGRKSKLKTVKHTPVRL